MSSALTASKPGCQGWLMEQSFSIPLFDHHEGKCFFETLGRVVSDLVQLHVDPLYSCCDPVPCFGPRTKSARVSERNNPSRVRGCDQTLLSFISGRVYHKLFFFFFVLGETRCTLENFCFCRADHFISALPQLSLKVQACP